MSLDSHDPPVILTNEYLEKLIQGHKGLPPHESRALSNAQFWAVMTSLESPITEVTGFPVQRPLRRLTGV